MVKEQVFKAAFASEERNNVGLPSPFDLAMKNVDENYFEKSIDGSSERMFLALLSHGNLYILKIRCPRKHAKPWSRMLTEQKSPLKSFYLTLYIPSRKENSKKSHKIKRRPRASFLRIRL